MKLDFAVLFPVLAVATWLGVPLYAALVRGRFYAIFSAVLLSVSLPGALVLHLRLRAALPAEIGVRMCDVAGRLVVGLERGGKTLGFWNSPGERISEGDIVFAIEARAEPAKI